MANEEKNGKSDSEKLASAQEALARNAKDREALAAENAHLQKRLDALSAQKAPAIGSRCVALQTLRDVRTRVTGEGDDEKTVRIPNGEFVVCEKGGELPFDPKNPEASEVPAHLVARGLKSFKGYSGLREGQHYKFV